MALHRNAEHSSKRGGRVDARGLLIIARLARTLELERDPSELCRRGCGVDERWAMSDHSAATTSLLAVCCRLSATAGRTLYPRSGLGDSNSMRKPLCPPYTHTHTHTNKREAEPKWRTHGISSDVSTFGRSLSPATTNSPKSYTAALFSHRYDFSSRSFVLSLTFSRRCPGDSARQGQDPHPGLVERISRGQRQATCIYKRNDWWLVPSVTRAHGLNAERGRRSVPGHGFGRRVTC
jgi:hypothetical protein